MPRRLDDLAEYFDPGLVLTVLGREYTLPLPSAELGLWVRVVAQAAGDIHAASTEQEMQAAVDRVDELPTLPGGKDQDFAQVILGAAHQQLVDDEVPDPYIQFCAATAYVWILAGEEKAAQYWTSGGRPEALGPANRGERRAQARTGRKSSAAAAGTRSVASTSGTRSPKMSSGNTPAKASRGRRS